VEELSPVSLSGEINSAAISLIRAATTPGAFVLAGAYTAPKWRRPISALLLIAYLGLVLEKTYIEKVASHPVWNTIILLICVASAVIGFLMARRETRTPDERENEG
jgi:hypothetical protein